MGQASEGYWRLEDALSCSAQPPSPPTSCRTSGGISRLTLGQKTQYSQSGHLLRGQTSSTKSSTLALGPHLHGRMRWLIQSGRTSGSKLQSRSSRLLDPILGQMRGVLSSLSIKMTATDGAMPFNVPTSLEKWTMQRERGTLQIGTLGNPRSCVSTRQDIMALTSPGPGLPLWLELLCA